MFNHPFLSEKRVAVPRNLLFAAVLLCGAVSLLLCLKGSTPPDAMSIAALCVAVALAFAGWSKSPSFAGRSPQSNLWLVLLAAGTAVGVVPLAVHDALGMGSLAWLLILPLLVWLHARTPVDARMTKHILVPLTFGSIFMFSTSVLGAPDVGAFPAVIGALFIAVIRATLDIEEDIFENHAGSDTLEVEHHYRHRLAVTAVIFFLFGTVSLWPWLGETYGKSYFWVLLIGVLLPLAFFWGRIRQPKLEGARTALIRFNRIAPILGLIHVLALVVA